jgi:histidyl-tRNA synthetase
MRDLLPREVELRDSASAKILEVYTAFGFRRIETPALENIRLLAGSDGGENEKLIYKVLKRGAKLESVTPGRDDELADLGLRFDLTVPLARYYAHNHAHLPDPFKAIQIGPVWRAERPQKGRFRQFTQCDIDILGLASEVAEIELILATCEAIITLGLEHPRVRLNDRRILAAVANHCGVEPSRHAGFFVTLDKLDKIGREGVERELRAEGHAESAISRLRALLWPSDAHGRRAPHGGDVLDRLCREVPAIEPFGESLRTVVRTVEPEAGQRFDLDFDPTLVRGMGYYTGPIFEVAYAEDAAAIAGGGRYDRMIGKLLGREVPACGFSIGFERVILILQEKAGIHAGERQRIVVLFDGTESLPDVFATARRLRTGGQVVSLTLRKKNLGKQLDDLADEGFGGYVVYQRDVASPQVRPLVRRSLKAARETQEDPA